MIFIKTAAAYIRVSTDDQTAYSPMVQKEAILNFAEKNTFFIPPEFIFSDEGISGRTAEKRPAFISMINCALKKKNNISAVIVHKYDRFARSRDDAVIYKAMLKKHGICVISVTEKMPFDHKFAVIYEAMLEAMAEYYSLNLSDEVKKTMIKKAEKGEYQAFAPFGYKNENKTLTVIPFEREIVKMIFQKYVFEDIKPKDIAKILNSMNIKTHRGNKFETRNIEYILNNPVYCGFVRWTPCGKINRDFTNKNSLISKGTFESIIDKELFEKAKEKYRVKKYN